MPLEEKTPKSSLSPNMFQFTLRKEYENAARRQLPSDLQGKKSEHQNPPMLTL